MEVKLSEIIKRFHFFRSFFISLINSLDSRTFASATHESSQRLISNKLLAFSSNSILPSVLFFIFWDGCHMRSLIYPMHIREIDFYLNRVIMQLASRTDRTYDVLEFIESKIKQHRRSTRILFGGNRQMTLPVI